MMLIRHGTPAEKRAWRLAFTPYAREPTSRVSADAVGSGHQTGRGDRQEKLCDDDAQRGIRSSTGTSAMNRSGAAGTMYRTPVLNCIAANCTELANK